MTTRIIVAGNGPSAQTEAIAAWADMEDALVMRCNYFFQPREDALRFRVDHWFLCEDRADYRLARLWQVLNGARMPELWLPGLNLVAADLARESVPGATVHIQRLYGKLPAACRWEADLAPQRPLMGSFALAVAVGMCPDEIYLCGHDLFQHPTGGTHGGVGFDERSWQPIFNRQYLRNVHRNHTLRGDLRYIEGALSAYKGHLVCVGSVMRHFFGRAFPKWEWREG